MSSPFAKETLLKDAGTDGVTLANTSPIAITQNTTRYSHPIQLLGASHALYVKISGGSLKIEIETAPSEVGTPDTTAFWTPQSSAEVIAALTSTSRVVYQIYPPPARWIRFKLTENNSAACSVTATLVQWS